MAKFPMDGFAPLNRLLVTGFGPFPGVVRNPSAKIARRVAFSPRWRLIGVEVRLLLLPTAYAVLDDLLAPALRDESIGAVLMIGVAGRAKQVRVEQRALNRAGILAPDATRRRPTRLTVATGPARRSSAVPAARMLAYLRRAGVPALVSQDAGRYLCNAAYFKALALPVPVLFVHIPKPPRRRPSSGGFRWRETWHDRLSRALTHVALDLLRQRRQRSSIKRALA
jgi:pyroglutamyl-peptidase